MHPDKWPEVKEKILSSYKILNQQTAQDSENSGETAEIIEFEGPLGKMKLEWAKRPKVLGKKTQYSNRIGGDISVDYILSDSEFTYALGVFKWNEAMGEWEELNAENFI